MQRGACERVLLIDGYVAVDPAAGLRQRAEELIAARSWSTEQILYGDQAEPVEAEPVEAPGWSMTFELGLDHVPTTPADWFEDVAALLAFTKTVQRELRNEFAVEVRYRSAEWYSLTIWTVDEEPLDLPKIRTMIERAVHSPPRERAQRGTIAARPWWKFW